MDTHHHNPPEHREDYKLSFLGPVDRSHLARATPKHVDELLRGLENAIRLEVDNLSARACTIGLHPSDPMSHSASGISVARGVADLKLLLRDMPHFTDTLQLVEQIETHIYTYGFEGDIRPAEQEVFLAFLFQVKYQLVRTWNNERTQRFVANYGEELEEARIEHAAHHGEQEELNVAELDEYLEKSSLVRRFHDFLSENTTPPMPVMDAELQQLAGLAEELQRDLLRTHRQSHIGFAQHSDGDVLVDRLHAFVHAASTALEHIRQTSATEGSDFPVHFQRKILLASAEHHVLQMLSFWKRASNDAGAFNRSNQSHFADLLANCSLEFRQLARAEQDFYRSLQ